MIGKHRVRSTQRAKSSTGAPGYFAPREGWVAEHNRRKARKQKLLFFCDNNLVSKPAKKPFVKRAREEGVEMVIPELKQYCILSLIKQSLPSKLTHNLQILRATVSKDQYIVTGPQSSICCDAKVKFVICHRLSVICGQCRRLLAPSTEISPEVYHSIFNTPNETEAFPFARERSSPDQSSFCGTEEVFAAKV